MSGVLQTFLPGLAWDSDPSYLILPHSWNDHFMPPCPAIVCDSWPPR
jgi:hypothetical protein